MDDVVCVWWGEHPHPLFVLEPRAYKECGGELVLCLAFSTRSQGDPSCSYFQAQ